MTWPKANQFANALALASIMLIAGIVFPAEAQYPGHTQQNDAKKVKSPRAISVLEWTGDAGKPKASRIVPVSVFVDGGYQDAGLYMAKPAPLAVESDTVYELQQAGVPQGLFDIAGGENVQGSWYGFGEWKPLAAPPPVKHLKPARVPARIVQDNDPDRPQFKGAGAKGGGESPSNGQTGPGADTGVSPSASPPADDPDKPTLHRRTDSGSGSQTSSGNSSAGNSGTTTSTSDDPDKPTLHRRSDSGDNGQAESGAGTAPDDPDRPHMKKRTDAGPTAASSNNDAASVGMANNVDPERPQMMHGKPAASEKEFEATKLSGMPQDLKQMAAVSDSATREEHPFSYQWPSPDDAAKMQSAVEALALKAVLPSNASTPKQTSAAPVHAGAPRSTLAHRVPTKVQPVTLMDKEFHAFELSYSGGPTVVLSARAVIGSDNAGKPLEKYVTIIAQPDFDGVPQVRLQSVTDANHLDMTPRMRLVDAVDAQGDNRAELLFELRRTTDRQFAIYKILGLHAEQAFATGSLPYATLSHVEIKAN